MTFFSNYDTVSRLVVDDSSVPSQSRQKTPIGHPRLRRGKQDSISYESLFLIEAKKLFQTSISRNLPFSYIIFSHVVARVPSIIPSPFVSTSRSTSPFSTVSVSELPSCASTKSFPWSGESGFVPVMGT